VRGTDGSEGSQGFFNERDDGRATGDWIAAQPWFNGHLGTYGASYMGFTQWALASTDPSYLDAMVISLSSRRSSWYPGGALALELMINWDLSALAFLHPERGGFLQDITPEGIERQQRMLTTAFNHLPLGDALLHVAGENHPLYEQQLAHPTMDDPYWAGFKFESFLDHWTVPTLLIDSWFDAPLPGVCEDFAVLRAGGAPVGLRIGAGGHLEGGGEGAADAALAWFDRYLLGDESVAVGAPVAVHVQGAGGHWRELEDWPPPPSVPTRWYLHPGGRLSTDAPSEASAPDTYRYDPADPTPSLGGTGLMTGATVDNGPLEGRADVLLYTSDVLDAPTEFIGPVEAELVVSSTLDHTDFFVRVCDVQPDGHSFNVCDALQRFDPGTIARRADGTFVAAVSVWPIGHRFGVGHRIRVHVSSGAHPVYSRNLGTGDPPATATEMRVADQAVYHDAERSSSITLPLFPA
jgi:putative CocE/NonD family hydrolase